MGEKRGRDREGKDEEEMKKGERGGGIRERYREGKDEEGKKKVGRG